MEAITAEVKRRLPRKRVRIVKVTVNGEEVDGKECTKCGVVKALAEYAMQDRGSGGKQSSCRECMREINRKYRADNPEKKRDSVRKWREANPEKERAHSRKWAKANPEKIRELRQNWRANNPDYIRNYRTANPEKERAASHRRLAMKRALPSDWTSENETEVLALFNGTCALSQSSGDIHLDHVIPLAWGHGGSVVGNEVPLSGALNLSKNDAHVYEWFDANRQRFELDESRFDDMVAVIAAQNGLTPGEYRQYYDWCYANRRTVAQTKRNNAKYGYKRPSLELWREATGIPFPLRIDFHEQVTKRRRQVTRNNENLDDPATVPIR